MARALRDSGAAVIRLAPCSPNLNAYAERFARSIKHECLSKMIFVGQGLLRRAVREYAKHYHEERNHQGLGNRLVRLHNAGDTENGRIRRKARLGGMLNFYARVAA
jgi:transposase InsO family protein